MPTAPKTYRPPGVTPAQQEAGWASRRAPGRCWYNTTRWRRIRLSQLRDEPLCHMCKMPATVADHVKPHGWDYDAFWNGELQSLCASCHNSKTAGEDGAFGK